MKTVERTLNQKYKAVLLFLLLFSLFFSGCATYHPGTLPADIDLVKSIDQLTGHDNALSEIKEGLNLTDIAVYAVFNNPDLKAQRKQLGIKRAELFAEGLLPDPQFSASLEHPTSALPDLFNGYGIGVGYDFISLINRKARVESKKDAQEQSRLELLWEEWQVSQRARVLAVKLDCQQKQLHLLEEINKKYEERYHKSSDAVSRGDVIQTDAGSDLVTFLDTMSTISGLKQAVNDTCHELKLLLGLSADAPFKISIALLESFPDDKIWHQGLQTLQQRRPDLRALRAGYRSQEAKVRAAILSQFPSLGIGVSHAKDTGDVKSLGFSIDFSLPLFSGNRGGIAIERATREQLAAEYQARLDETATEIDRLIELQKLVSEQMIKLDKYVPVLKSMVDNGHAAYKRGDIDAVTFLNMESAWVEKRLEQIDLAGAQRTNLIALQTLLALPPEITLSANYPQGDENHE